MTGLVKAFSVLTLVLLLLGVGQPIAVAMAAPETPTMTTIATFGVNCGGDPMLVYEGYVFWPNYCTNTLQRVAETGGSIENVTTLPGASATSPVEVIGLAALGPWVFWTQWTANLTTFSLNPGTLDRVPVWGGVAQQMMVIGTTVAGIAAGYNDIYFLNNGTLTSITAYGTGIRAVASGPDAQAWQIAVSQGNPYWFNAGNSQVYSFTASSYALTQVTNVTSGPSLSLNGDQNLVVANGTIIWSASGISNGTLYSQSVNGGPAKTLYESPDLDVIEAVAVAGPNIAFAAAGSGNISEWGLFMVPQAGGPVTPLLTGAVVQDLAVSGNTLFFAVDNFTGSTIESVPIS